jgi:hypothetical protein
MSPSKWKKPVVVLSTSDLNRVDFRIKGDCQTHVFNGVHNRARSRLADAEGDGGSLERSILVEIIRESQP